MKLLRKQLIKELLKNKIFLFLMLLLSIATSFMYFFVQFSIDGNMRLLNSLPELSTNQLEYRNALDSNSILANSILAGFVALTVFVLVMFFYRFFKANAPQLGGLKTLGFRDTVICRQFLLFTMSLSLTGGLIGLLGGYFLSDTLMEAGRESYQIAEQIKAISFSSLLAGLGIPLLVFCTGTYLSYFLIRGKETGILMAGMDNQMKDSRLLHIADKLADLFPVKRRLSVRLALRKPITVILILISVMSFSVMFILAYSLNLSSPKLVESQTIGHNELYEIQYDDIQEQAVDSNEMLTYLSANGTIQKGNVVLERTLAGINENKKLLELQDPKGDSVEVPKKGEAVIGVELQALYDLSVGDEIAVKINGVQKNLQISAIALNAEMNWVYCSKADICNMINVPEDSYNGIWSLKEVRDGDRIITKEQKQEDLARSTVSNKTSAVINQVMGCFIGCILLFLALFLNFQSSTKDILILHLMGYQTNAIHKMLIDIYKPIVWISFVITLLPSVWLVKTILKSLSIQIGDYMAFQTNSFVIAGIFILLNLLYIIVQKTFNGGIRRMKKDLL